MPWLSRCSLPQLRQLPLLAHEWAQSVQQDRGGLIGTLAAGAATDRPFRSRATPMTYALASAHSKRMARCSRQSTMPNLIGQRTSLWRMNAPRGLASPRLYNLTGALDVVN